nr:immunoglobulin light chain junction region [Macaca mulatta]
CGQGTYVPLTF